MKELYQGIEKMANNVIEIAESQYGLELYIPATGKTRTVDDQIRIYGKERWTVHYIGCAVDIYPRLRCRAEDWQKEFNGWPHWDLLQLVIAVRCGFDEPQQWQLDRDRPHVQCLFGVGEEVLRSLYYNSHSDVESVWAWLNVHRED